jgi:hypothetical protein
MPSTAASLVSESLAIDRSLKRGSDSNDERGVFDLLLR